MVLDLSQVVCSALHRFELRVYRYLHLIGLSLKVVERVLHPLGHGCDGVDPLVCILRL